MRRIRTRRIVASIGMLLCMLLVRAVPSRANGELLLVKAPEEVPEGDEITLLITATPREKDIDRVLAISYPESWKIKQTYKVEAGTDAALLLRPFAEIQDRFTREAGHNVIALADDADEFDPDAPGIAYYVVFSTKALPGPANNQVATVKAVLVERNSPNAPPEIDKKTKKPKPRNTNWRMTFPAKGDFSFEGVSGKRSMQSIHLLRIAKTARALVLDGGGGALATLRTKPEVLSDYFTHPFSISFWFRTISSEQTFLRLSGERGEIKIGTGSLGQPVVSVVRPKPQGLVSSKAIVSDGAWHNLALSKDSVHKLRLFLDGQAAVVGDGSSDILNAISAVEIGNGPSVKRKSDMSIDELRFLRNAYTDPTEFDEIIAVAARDTMQDAFALFHFDEFGDVARSSVPLIVKTEANARGEFVPISFALDSLATITETTSPVQLDQVMLSVDLLSPTKVNINWHTTTELGIKQYALERRIGSFGAFEEVLVADAKHGLKTPKRGQSIISRNSYSANEELPKLNGDIELYYRLALLGFDDEEEPLYSQPIKLEYGADRDVFVEQNSPNPFNPTTSIAIRLTKANTVRLSIFDIIGREVGVLVNGKVDAGRHVYTLDATSWPGGIYFYKVKTPKTTVTRKMVLAK